MDFTPPIRKLLVTIGGALLAYTLYRLVAKIILAYDKHLRKIPGPWLNAFSNVPLKLAVLSGDRTFYIHRLHQKYGPMVRITPNEVAVVDIDATLKIHRIGTEFRKGTWYQGQSPFQNSDETAGVFGIRGLKNAKVRRKYFQQAGSRKIVPEWEDQIKAIVHNAVAKIKRDAKKGNADIVKWWSLMAADVLGDVAFGEKFGMVEGEKKTQMMEDVELAMLVIGIRMELPWIWPIIGFTPLPATRKIYNLMLRFNEYGYTAVQNSKLAASGKNKTLFSKMVPEDGSAPLSDDVIKNESLNVIIAGTDTTAMTLSYLVYAVLSDDAVRRRLLEDLQKCPAHPTMLELEALPYLNAVISETLRLYAAVPASLPRTVPEGGAMLGGYFIPGDITVSTQAYTLHRDPNVWPEPERFNPDRWLDPTPEMNDHFFAFGGSARTCIGQNIARLEMLHAVHTFFTELPDAKLSSSTTAKSMDMVEYFVIKPKAGKCDITVV